MQNIDSTGNNFDYNTIEEYVLKTLGLSKKDIDISAPDKYVSNFIHLMCIIVSDIREIDERIKQYKILHDQIKEKGIEADYKKRKFQYFIKINKEAQKEICSFLSHSVPEYLSRQYGETIIIEREQGKLPLMCKVELYKYSLFKDYYSCDYRFDIAVKVAQYVKDTIDFDNWIIAEQRIMEFSSSNPDQIMQTLYTYVDENAIMEKLVTIISTCYHLYERKEIFETLQDLFAREDYKSFLAIGSIQIEGLFNDWCNIVNGEKDHGTLIEKAQKVLNKNDFVNFRMYPYFAYDSPILRNEAAHTGKVNIDITNAKETAYNLVLDLNTLSQMVYDASCEKYFYLMNLNDRWSELESNSSDKNSIYYEITHQIYALSLLTSEHFLKLIKNPDAYKNEVQFYINDEIFEGLSDIIQRFSAFLRSENFWNALNRMICSKEFSFMSADNSLLNFTRKVMNDHFINNLNEEARKECCKVSALIKDN